MNNKKIIIFASLAISLILTISVAVYFFLPKQSKKNNLQRNLNTKEENTLQEYVRNVLLEKYYDSPNLTIRQRSVYLDDTSRYKSSVWSKNGVDIYFQGFYSIKGNTYKDSNIPLDFDVMVKKTIQKGLTDEQKTQVLNEIFKDNYFGNVNKFTVNNEVNDVDIVDNSENRAADKPDTKKYTIKDRSRITEYVWENPDKTLESRAVWVIDEDDKNEIAYFTACRIFPESPLYLQKTCFQRN